MLREARRSGKFASITRCLAIGSIGFCCLFSVLSAADRFHPRILLETDSQYYRIYISEEDDGLRHISFGKAQDIQSTVRLGHPEELIYPYARTVMAGLAFLPEAPGDMACIGLGGGSLPMFLHHFHPDMRIDVVEIDPKVVQLAKDYLEYKPDLNIRTIAKDGRIFLRRTKRSYDFIILDAYNTQTIPFHLTTKEFLETVRSRLSPGGVAVAHIWAEDKNPYLDYQAATYLAVFDHVYLFRARQSGSYIFVAQRSPVPVPATELRARARAIDASFGYPFKLAPIVADQRASVTESMREAPVLTDDHAPVNLLRTRKRSSGDVEKNN